MTSSTSRDMSYGTAVAIIGMAGRFPGAPTTAAFWENIAAGRRSIRSFTEEELLAAGVDPALLRQPNYVKAGTVVEDMDRFDAGFFGYPPREAEIMDPQHRLFLECAWEALEHAAYNPEAYPGLIGVFAGSPISTYLVHNIAANPEVMELMGDVQIDVSNNVDALASTVSYKLNLRGPSVAVQTFCSTSLVGVHLACQSLLTYECDLALAGGVVITVPHGTGYLYQEGSILSPDGHCRTFDAHAQGSVMGSGMGIVVLKRMEEALADGDTIYAVIRGSAINNDGVRKVGYTAPGLNGQSSAIARALKRAGVKPETVSYIEAHGTGTPLGDSVELAAMIRAFRRATQQKQFCAIGSVKPNVGHLDRASGIAGLIKTTLALVHQQLPPSIDFEAPSPDIDLDNSPFYVNTTLRPWPANGAPRRAGVSSFGLGGTNAHIVLEEAPPPAASSPARPSHLLLLSAKTASALETATANLVAHCRQHPDLNPADLAYTLQVGRAAFNHRRFLVCRDLPDAIAALDPLDPARLLTLDQTSRDRPLAFVFPGVGDHYAGMAQELYLSEPTFRATVDHACTLLLPLLGQDLRQLLYPAGSPAPSDAAAPSAAPDLRALLGRSGAASAAAQPLHQTALAQPAVFVVEYALAQLLMQWGLRPQALLGYSLGEYVAACLAGVLSLEDALRLVATRAQLIQALPAGAMLAVSLHAAEVQPFLSEAINLAAINSPSTCVLAGPPDAIAALEQQLAAQEVASRRVETTHAFHSAMLTPIREQLTALVRTLTLHPPQLPYISNVSGTWITAEQATDPSYWARHMCETVRFAEGVGELLRTTQQVVLEVGPGQGLSSFVKQHGACTRERLGQVVWTLAGASERQSDRATLLTTLGKLWQLGVSIDWRGFYGEERRQRLALPTYPFERQRYWIEPSGSARIQSPRPASIGKRPDIADWFYTPVWQTVPLPESQVAAKAQARRWLIFTDRNGLSGAVMAQLERDKHTAIQVHVGDAFARMNDHTFCVRPDQPADYQALVSALRDAGQLPTHILHLWSAAPPDGTGSDYFQACQQTGFYSLLFLTRALGQHLIDESIQLVVATNGMQAVTGQEPLVAEQATILGLCIVISQENITIRCRSVDLLLPTDADWSVEAPAAQLLAECTAATTDLVVAYRGAERWVQTYAPLRLEALPAERPPLRQQGVYMITGGLGGVGPILAAHLARTAQAKLVLVGRTALPPRAEWAEWLASHDDGDSLSQKLHKVQALEALGAEVEVLSADVADEVQMRAVLDQTIARFGALHGVIHAAGITTDQSYGLIQDISRTQCEWHFQPKSYGLYVLEKVLLDQPLDFCVLFSSISTVLGGLGFAGYAAANSFMDAFAKRHNQTQPVKWTSIDWDTWQLKEGQHDVLGGTVAQYEMLPVEGVQAFERVLAARDQAQIVNSTGDLDARIRQWVQLESLRTADDSEEIQSHPQTQVLTIGEYEERIAAIWRQVLGMEQVGIHDNFFDLGGNSLIGLQLIAKLKKEFKIQVPAVALFEAPTVSALAQYLMPEQAPVEDQQSARLEQRRQRTRQSVGRQGIAIIGMVGRFPGADTVEQFWQNLHDGVESLATFSEAELLASGVDPVLLHNPNYIKARPILSDVEHFDAAFFGYTPREAEYLDPQQRLFHECAWEALEVAGYDSQRYKGLIGVFGGTNMNYYLTRLIGDPDFTALSNDLTAVENDKDGLTTNVSYKLNLRGPSFGVQTYCSTSLVATHLACRSLLNGECDIALAGGVSVRVPVKAGYLYQEGDQVSEDGHCRTFDARAKGATFGDGVAIVALKRLEDAIEDGDTIHAVIKGSAVNNDGGLKVGYMAPSVVGQSEVIIAALADAAIDPATISYVEAHGTATVLGDPIEVAALTKAFRTGTDKVGYCAIGSVKPNVGHLDRAAGVTGLIKTVMALKHELLPATLHFERPNPEIDFASSPFVVNARLSPWNANGAPRRAGINSLGVGGTNAHVIVEEAPALPAPSPARPYQLLLLSARTPSALDAATANLHAYLSAHPDAPLADVAYTLQVGRRVFDQRRMLLCRDQADALHLLAAGDPKRVSTLMQKPTSRPVAWLFPGVGDHYAGMAHELYQTEPVFRSAVERCCRLLTPHLGRDLREVLYPQGQPLTETPAPAPTLDLRTLLGRNGHEPSAANGELHQTALAQPAVFVVEYALAQLLLHWGLRPQALLGYSLGEYVAACLAGVLSLDDALLLVARRAQLIQALPNGAMLAVSLSEAQVQPFLSDTVNLAVVNAPSTCVLAGPPDAIAALEQQLAAQEIACRRVETTHAFHSAMLAPIREELTALARTLTLHPPRIPYLSNVSGSWISEEQATDPAYWAAHMCSTVRFAEGVAELLQQGEQVLLEVGPGQALGSFVRQHPACTRERMGLVLATLPGATERQSDRAGLLTALGKLWLLDVPIEWTGFYADERRQRLPLPTYPFERQRFWAEPNPQNRIGAAHDISIRRSDIADWFATASWKRANSYEPIEADTLLADQQCWLVLVDECGVGTQLVDWLAARQQEVITVTPGAAFARQGANAYSVRPNQRADYETLLQELERQGKVPRRVVHLWSVTMALVGIDETDAGLAEILEHGFYSLLALTQALGDQGVEACEINVVSSDMQEVLASDQLCPAKATLIGPCKIIPQEYPNLSSRSIDIVLDTAGKPPAYALIEQLARELVVGSDDMVALRGPHRWVQIFEPIKIPGTNKTTRLREHGVYLITGGLGGIGLAIAEYLVDTVQARLVLLGRSALPARETWPEIIATHGADAGIGRRVHIVQALEARGAEVLVLQADVADSVQMQAAVQQAVAHFGTINGVIHTAGVPGVGLMQLKTPETAAGTLASKVQGTLALTRALEGLPLDFLVLFSSVTSATGGGPGQVDYCAANAFLDAYAQRHNSEHGITVAISWGEWRWDAWSEGLQGFPEDVRVKLIATRRAYGIRFDEGMEALRRVLSRTLPHVFVTTQDLIGMVEGSKRSSAAVAMAQYQEQQQSRPLYPRPVLGTSYVAPENEVEEKIIMVWGEVLGIDQIGTNDNFFELGGNSLIGIQIIARLRRIFQVNMPLVLLFETPTVAEMAVAVEIMLIDKIEKMDEEDVAQLIQ